MESKIVGKNDERVVVEVKGSAFDLSKFKTFNSKYNGYGVLTIVYSESNGKRIKLSKGLLEQLGDPEKLQFAYHDGTLAIVPALASDSTFIKISKGGVVYSAAMIKGIVDEFELDYSDRVSITFHNVEYHENDGVPLALVEMTQ